jgi:hypothetical protein
MNSWAEYRATHPGAIARVLTGLWFLLYGLGLVLPAAAVAPGWLQAIALVAGVAWLVGL